MAQPHHPAKLKAMRREDGDTMRKLIARLEAATGPDRELDGEIFRLVDERPGDNWVTFDRDGAEVWFHECRDERGAFIAPAFYTASFDAALLLVPEGKQWGLTSSDRPVDGGDAHAWVSMKLRGPTKHGRAVTPAIALCIAALRARVALASASDGKDRK